MSLGKIASKILMPSLERDLSRTLTKEVGAMDELLFMAGRVFSYQSQAVSNPSAFASTSIRQSPAGTKLVRVEKPVTSKGLFSE
jgi:hypothetical protein